MSKVKLQIKSIIGKILFEYEKEDNTIKETVVEFLKENAGKIIQGANLSEMDLSGVSFDNSSFYNSSFYNSSFDNSSFDNSSFYNSRFDNSSFDNSSFDNSSFDNSSFDNSSFYNSSFDNSRFDSDSAESALKSGGLESIKNDFFGRMLRQKNEVPFLKQAIIDGTINGSQYEGDCCCFVGTIAKAAHCNYKELPRLKPDSSSSTEKWFMALRPGHTPENSAVAKITVEWIEEFEMLLKI